MAFGVAKAKLAFGVTAELELAVMDEVMVGGAEEQAVLARVSAAAASWDDMVHVDVAAPAFAGHAATAAVAQHHRAAQGCRYWAAALDGAALSREMHLALAAAQRSGARRLELERPDAGVELALATAFALIENDRAARIARIGILVLRGQCVASDGGQSVGVSGGVSARRLGAGRVVAGSGGGSSEPADPPIPTPEPPPSESVCYLPTGTLAAAQAWPVAVALDATHVYWATGAATAKAASSVSRSRGEARRCWRVPRTAPTAWRSTARMYISPSVCSAR